MLCSFRVYNQCGKEQAKCDTWTVRKEVSGYLFCRNFSFIIPIDVSIIDNAKPAPWDPTSSPLPNKPIAAYDFELVLDNILVIDHNFGYVP